MSVAIPIPLLQHLPDVNVTPAVGVDEYALVWDNDTARFVLRAPAAGLLATGATVGATAQAQRFTFGVISPFDAPAADSATAWQVRKADGATSVINVDTVDGLVGIGMIGALVKLQVAGAIYATGIATNTWSQYGGDYIGCGSYWSLRTDAAFGIRIDTFGLSGSAVTIQQMGNVGINDTAPAEKLDVTGNINATGVYKVDDVQVLSNRVIDARCADVANSGDATTDGLIDALRDAMVAHGLVAAA